MSAWTRRAFLKAGAATLTAVASGCASPPPTRDDAEPWIDAHAHVWAPDDARFPRVADGHDMKPSSFPAEIALAHAKQHGLGRMVLVQPACYGLDHRYIEACMAAHPGRFGGVGLVDWKHDPVAGLDELHAKGLRGVRVQALHRHYHRWLDWPKMHDVWDRASELGMSVCILSEPRAFSIIDRMCDRHPRTRVVLDHFGWIGARHVPSPQDVDALCRLARHEELRVKLSRLHDFASGRPPYDEALPVVRRTVQGFGAERCMWGSDLPGQVIHGDSYADALELVRERAELTPEQREHVLRRTAEGLFFDA